jgi:ketosteroid isomerase-like protein
MTNAINETNIKTFPVLSIDAWGNETDGYEWNQWFNVGSIDLDLDAEDRQIIQAMVNAGYLTALALESAEVEDDGFNIVILDMETREPVFAIEYGPTI